MYVIYVNEAYPFPVGAPAGLTAKIHDMNIDSSICADLYIFVC